MLYLQYLYRFFGEKKASYYFQKCNNEIKNEKLRSIKSVKPRLRKGTKGKEKSKIY